MKTKTMFLTAAVLFLLFTGFTVLVSAVDVQPIGPEGSEVGLAALNQWCFEHLGVHPIWYEITEVLGIIALTVAAGFGLSGLVQLIRRKSLRKVDFQILLLGAFYGITAAVYVFFECAAINYRPVLLDNALEASYPSSHTLLVLCIMGTAVPEFRRRTASRKRLRTVLETLSYLMMAVTVIGRLLSGVHWFTDIAGGVLLSAALGMTCTAAVRWIGERKTDSLSR